MIADGDRLLRQLERDGLVIAGSLTAGALLVTLGRWDVALGVAGGACLTAFSYNAIRGGTAAVLSGVTARPVPAGSNGAPAALEGPGTDPLTPALSRGRRLFLAVKFFTRYALLAVGAYVMLTRFRLHPVGLLVGALTPFLAAVVQVARMSRAR